jgi:hypothetical protein
MSGGFETVSIIDTWLYSVLSGDTFITSRIGGVGGIISTLAKAGVKAPYVVFFLSSSRDINVVGGIRSQVDSVYTVKAVSEGPSWAHVKPLAERMDALLHGQDVTTSNGSLSCRRESIIQYAEVDQATQFRHLGATYRIRANSL